MADTDLARTSRASILSHPIHPMLIAFPVALISLAPLSDIIYLWTDQSFWARVSYYLLIGGLVSSVVAAAFGLWDFLAIPKARSLKAAWVHLASNVGAMALVLVNVLIRGDGYLDVGSEGLILSLAAAAFLTVGGWYGGELSYRHRIGVVEDPATE